LDLLNSISARFPLLLILSVVDLMFSAFIFFEGSELHDVKKKAIAKATKKK